MCGILGGSKKEWNYAEALESIYHRGPDGKRLIQIKGFTLGFTRLAVIDLNQDAMQPMFSKDNNYVIVFNGEIYGYQTIRNQLEKKGYVFRTKSDTEVLLYAFIEWGEKMADHLDGIFGMAVMDIREEKIYLFRDRPGVKPLYYFYDGKEFAFASELGELERLLCPAEDLKTDNTALYDYYNYLYIPEPKTLYKKVYKLEAASFLVYDLRKKRIQKKRRYWNVCPNGKEGEPISKRQLDKKAEELRYHLDRVIKRQIKADVPAGTFFSGGVDSSIVTLVASQYIKDATAYVTGFTDKQYDEFPYAKKIADYAGIKYKVKYFAQNDFLSLKDKLRTIFGEPFADLSLYPTYFVSEFAKQDITVVLTGDGGDELFGGYNRYSWAKANLQNRKYCKNKRIRKLYSDFKAALPAETQARLSILNDDIELLASQYLYGKDEKRKRLRKKYGIPFDYDDWWFYRIHYHKDLPIVTRLRYLDFMTYLPGDILTKVDRTSMQFSLEARVPLLDKEMIDFAFSLTQNEVNPNGELKGLFKYAYKDMIPLKFFERPKAGFMMPHKYMSGNNSIQDMLLEEFWRKKDA